MVNPIEEMLKTINPDIRVRHFVVDYRDNEMNYFHECIDAVEVGDITDEQTAENIFRVYEKRNYKAYTIVEAIGQYTPQELLKLTTDGEGYKKLVMNPIYIDKEEVRIAMADNFGFKGGCK